MNVIKKSILIVLAASDFNETEFLTVKNELEKEGFTLFIASDAHALCIGSGGLKVRPDVSFFNMRASNFGGMIIIGGNGIKNYWNNQNLHVLIESFDKSNKTIGAICSAPVCLSRAGILNDKEAVCFPDDKRELERDGAVYKDVEVLVRKNIISAKGPSSASEFVSTFIQNVS